MSRAAAGLFSLSVVLAAVRSIFCLPYNTREAAAGFPTAAMMTGIRRAAAVVLVAAAAVFLGGCEQFADYNRDYTATYDADSGRVGGEVRITGAPRKGEGRASVGVKVSGTVTNRPNLLEPDFKSVVPEMKGVVR